MGMLMLVWLVIIVGVAVVLLGFGSRQLPPPDSSDANRRLAEQIEQLEEELRQVKEQADFTERLLTERSDSPPGDRGKD